MRAGRQVVNNLTPAGFGSTTGERFAALEGALAGAAPGAHGLLALDWANGNRCVLGDARLTGLLVGQTLQTTAAEVFRALAGAEAKFARKGVVPPAGGAAAAGVGGGDLRVGGGSESRVCESGVNHL